MSHGSVPAPACAPVGVHTFLMRMKVRRWPGRRGGSVCAAVLALSFVACSGDGSTGPGERPVRVTVLDGDAQFALPRAIVDVPLSVRVTDATRGTVVENVRVTWRVVSGSGAAVTTTADASNGLGVASARLTLGADTGVYRIEATASRLVGDPAAFTARAVMPPVIQSVEPTTAVASATIVVNGTGFRSVASENAVLFGGLRGRVTAATTTRLDVQVPRCVLSRTVDLRVAIGAVTSTGMPVQTVAAAGPSISLAPGQTLRVDRPDDLACLPFDLLAPGSRFLVVPQNAVTFASLALPYELHAIGGGSPAVATQRPQPGGGHTDRAIAFETMLRMRERTLGPPVSAYLNTQAAPAATTLPNIGDRRDFNVLTTENRTRRVNATVMAISDRAILYVDGQAPAGGLTTADLERFGDLFDDPIYSTDVEIFGAPSDIDQNDRIIVVFTPAVNALTEQSAAGFIAGYFYGCDLVEASRCSSTNSGEIFYSMVPDPNGVHGGARTKDVVLRTVPGVLAHEFQHMINFHRKGGRLDVLWLSEGLAHAAEDLVGDEFFARGDPVAATDFKRPNFVRTQFWLREVAQTDLVTEDSPGSLEERGAAWLLVRYLIEHYGGTALLGQLTGSTAIGADNVTSATGRTWLDLLSEFAVAVWADRAPELAGLTLAPRLTLGAFDLRAELGRLAGGFPLTVPVIGAATPNTFPDLFLSQTLNGGAHDYFLLHAPALTPPRIHLAFTGLRGGPFAPFGTPQLTLLRLR